MHRKWKKGAQKTVAECWKTTKTRSHTPCTSRISAVGKRARPAPKKKLPVEKRETSLVAATTSGFKSSSRKNLIKWGWSERRTGVKDKGGFGL